MTCDDVSRNEIVEKYLLDQLDDESRDSFEQHYFECARCFDVLQTYRDVQAELERTRATIVTGPRQNWIRQWAWLPAAAAVLIAVSVVVWQRPTPGNVGPASVEAPSPDRSASAGSASSPAASAGKPSLDDLARFEPPRYVPGRLRGAADAATVKFQAAMDHYHHRDYAGAHANLQEARALDPEAPHIGFFLGISALLIERPDEAADILRKTTALGDSPYLEEAHFYLAKAYLKLRRVDDATAELEQVIQLRGDHQAEARQLRTTLGAFKNRPQ